MEWIKSFVDLFLHLDEHLDQLIGDYGPWIYLILFLIIFCETGLVVTPFLPGDSLLFMAGAFAGQGKMNLALLFVLLTVAGILGDAVNYAVGAYLGPKVLKRNGRFLKPEYIARTQRFYERYGNKTIVLARFVPIVRTFAPFLAGVGQMTYWRFASYNVIGALVWVTLFLVLGYFFGQFKVVKENVEVLALAIVFISVLPMVWEWWRHRKSGTEAAAVEAESGH
ncbi:MAG: DedA family protein [Planctomycetaceae bacterium]|nr:DedA family protein [Planctomycetaceae bacterium]